MSDPAHQREALDGILDHAAAAARRYLDGIDADPVLPAGAEAAAAAFGGSLPRAGERPPLHP